MAETTQYKRKECEKSLFEKCSVFAVPLEGLKSQGVFEEMRQNYIRELTKAIHMKEKGLVASSQRFYHLTKLMDAMHDVGSFTRLYHIMIQPQLHTRQTNMKCLLCDR